MPLFVRRMMQAFLAAIVAVVPAYAASNPHLSVRAQARVVESIDNNKVVALANTHPGNLAGAVDLGRVPASTQFNHMLLVLKSSDEQMVALQGLIDDQQDKASPNYHQWISPDAFAAAFGVASSDISQVTAWLQDQGFSVDSISAGRRVIQFSGTSAQVEKAFHTEMHNVSVNGETHITNTVDVSVPEALAPVLSGIASLNDFLPKPHLINPHQVLLGSHGQVASSALGGPVSATPQYTSLSSGSHFVGPADVATIYNAKPLLANGINGTGVTIGVIGQTSVAMADIETFRSLFQLPNNDPKIINVGPAPAVIADDIESDLDLEWAGALATAATVDFYTAAGSLFDGGVSTSALTAVDSNVADILSLSYGGCELSNGASGTAYWNNLWQQAAAQGQSVFVSSGDSSATGCANSSATYATGSTAGTYAVNALGSGAYNTAVGGSEFNEGTTLGVTSYWGAGGTAPYGTALSYIPETVWSEGAFDIVQPSSGVAGGGGGVSIFTARPAWQTGPGISPTADPAGPTFTAAGALTTGLHRLAPDLALIAASGHDGTIFCSEGVCRINSDGSVGGLGIVGGTSVATPVMAGIQALINQQNGGRQGLANYYYYKLAAAQTTANCASTLPPAATCNFNDIVSGDNYSPKDSTGKYIFPVPPATTGTISGTLGTDYIGFPATAGYDTASGLGTPNITNVATNWKTVTFNASKTALTLTPTTTTHGTAIKAVVTVTAATGTPTGAVSFTAVGQSAGAGDGNVYTLSGGTVTASLTALPGGTYSVVAHYAGDGTYGASNSTPVTVTISPEPSTTYLTPYNITTAGAVNPQSTYAYGTSIYFDTEILGNSATGYTPNGGVPNTGVPTGSVLYNVSSGSTTFPAYTGLLDSYGTTYLEVAQTFASFLITANYPALSPGSYTVKATYSGDSSFNSSNASASVTVVQASVLPTLRTATSQIASGATASFNVTMAASGGGVLPTGTVTLTDTTTSTTLGSGKLANGAVVITSTGIVTNGAHSITASYGGDTNYAPTTSTAVTVTVGGSASSITLAASTTTAKVLTTVSFIATVPSGQTGTVYFYDGAVSLGSAAISTTTYTASLNVSTLAAGTHTVTATYAGSSTLQASTSSPVTVVMTQNTPSITLTSQQANNSANTVSMNAVLALSPGTGGAANPAPSAAIQFLDGTTVLGSTPAVRTLNYGYYTAAFTSAPLKPGIHTLTSMYPGDANYAAATSPTQTVSIGLTTTTVTSSTNSVGTGIVFTLTATITPLIPNTAAIGGTVTFKDGATTIGTAPVVNGVATLSTATLNGVGTHTVTAVYSGDANYYTSTSTVGVTIVTVTPNFTLTVNPTALTIARGSSGSATLTTVSTGNYNGFGSFACSGLPAYTFCTFSQPAFLFTGTNGTQTATVTITTLAPSAVTGRGAGMLWLPAVLLAGFLGLRRKQLSLRGRQLVAVAILLCGTMAMSGCGSNVNVGSPTGTSNVVITASGNGSTSASPNINPTATIALTIQ